MVVRENALVVVLAFEFIEQSVARILRVTLNMKQQFGLFKVPLFH